MGILKIYVIVVTIESFEQILDFWHIFFTNQDHFRPLGIGGIRNFTHYGKGKGKNGRKNNQMTHQFHNFLLVVGSLAFIEVIVLQNSDPPVLRIFKNNPQCPPPFEKMEKQPKACPILLYGQIFSPPHIKLSKKSKPVSHRRSP